MKELMILGAIWFVTWIIQRVAASGEQAAAQGKAGPSTGAARSAPARTRAPQRSSFFDEFVRQFEQEGEAAQRQQTRAPAHPAEMRPRRARPVRARPVTRVQEPVKAAPEVRVRQHHLHSQVEGERDLSEVDERHVSGQVGTSTAPRERHLGTQLAQSRSVASGSSPVASRQSVEALIGNERWSPLQRAYIMSEIFSRKPAFDSIIEGESDRF